ncbi:MAG: RDD family protein [Methylococcales bacterium]|nr:RDD family protein [Methylococcales bacterium]
MHTHSLEPRNKPIDHLSIRPGLLRRLAAVFYDGLLLLAVFFVATALLLPFNSGQAITATPILYRLYLSVVSFIFFGWFWTHGGQTLGSRAWKIKIQSFDQRPITWTQAAKRFMGLCLTLGIDLIWLAINDRYLALYERWSGSTAFFNDTPPSLAKE